MTKAWVYNGWTCTGDLQSDGSMSGATIVDRNGRTYDNNRYFGSVGDFKSFVDNVPKIKG